MKIVQKILSHGLLIAIVAAAFLAYTNRAEWFPQWFDKTGKLTRPVTDSSPVVAAPSATAEPEPSQSVRDDTTSKVPSARPETSEVPAQVITVQPAQAVQKGSELKTAPPHESETEAPAVVESVSAPQPAETPSEHSWKQPSGVIPGQVQSEGADTQPDQSPAVANPEPTYRPQQAEETTVPEKAELASSAGTSTAPVQAGDADQIQTLPPQAEVSPAEAQLENKLAEARQHYWDRDMQKAVDAYRMLSEEYPDNPDVWGEMGNFYFSARQRTPAANAYYRCIELLIVQGEQERARQLLNVLYKLDAPRARELATRMQQAGG